MFLALREMGRSVLKFGLLAAATGLLVFLLMFLGTLLMSVGFIAEPSSHRATHHEDPNAPLGRLR